MHKQEYLGDVRNLALNHLDAVNDGTDADTERAASTVLSDVRQVRLGIKGDGLVPRVVAGHVTSDRA